MIIKIRDVKDLERRLVNLEISQELMINVLVKKGLIKVQKPKKITRKTGENKNE